MRRLPEADIARRELWPCHGLRFWFGVPIPDCDGCFTSDEGICVQPNLHGSESLGPGLVETDGARRRLLLSRFCAIEILPSGVAGGTWTNGLLETPEFLRSARLARENETAALEAVRAARKKTTEEKMEVLTPLVLRWVRLVGLLAGLPDPDTASLADAAELYEGLKLSSRGLADIRTWLENHGVSDETAAVPKLSDYDPLREAQHAYSCLVRPDKITSKAGR